MARIDTNDIFRLLNEFEDRTMGETSGIRADYHIAKKRELAEFLSLRIEIPEAKCEDCGASFSFEHHCSMY